MNKPTSSKPWWSSLGFAPRDVEPDTDYADMGTAFGLDASMRPLPEDEDTPDGPPQDARSGAPGSRGKLPR